MKLVLPALFALVLAGCASSPPPAATSEPPAEAPPTAPNAPAPTPGASGTPAPEEGAVPAAPASREAREKRVIELLEGRVPQPDLPTDSGGG